MREIKRVFVHCSDSYAHMNINADIIREWHVNERGWNDIGYHYVILRNGEIENGRPVEIIGAGVKGHNSNSIHICMIGGKPDRGSNLDHFANFTFKQYQTLIQLREAIDTDYGNPTWLGHRDVDKGKTCPNFDVTALFE
jgi:N-acetylmuramoyl-L-alanine amidase